MYDLALRKSVERIFSKLAKKDPNLLKSISRKIEEIQVDPQRYKNLRRPLHHLKRVHIEKGFVLVFSVDETARLVIIEDFDHHDRIYRR
jgi:YafQ family addiction module toxin component